MTALVHVSPRLAPADERHKGGGDPVARGDGDVRSYFVPDFMSSLPCELRACGVLVVPSARVDLRRLPAFEHHVTRIVSWRAKPQMQGVAASRAVASVEHSQVGGYVSSCLLEGESVRQFRDSFPYPKAAVPVGVRAGRPEPAVFFPRHQDLRREPSKLFYVEHTRKALS